MLASNPAAILDQIFGRAGIALTQESTQDDHALVQYVFRSPARIQSMEPSAETCAPRRQAKNAVHYGKVGIPGAAHFYVATLLTG
jgi:hypothetical protein